jgi:hypothetical protein
MLSLALGGSQWTIAKESGASGLVAHWSFRPIVDEEGL